MWCALDCIRISVNVFNLICYLGFSSLAKLVICDTQALLLVSWLSPLCRAIETSTVNEHIYAPACIRLVPRNMAPTLIKPPPADPSWSAMENVLELVTLGDFGPVSVRSLSPKLGANIEY